MSVSYNAQICKSENKYYIQVETDNYNEFKEIEKFVQNVMDGRNYYIVNESNGAIYKYNEIENDYNSNRSNYYKIICGSNKGIYIEKWNGICNGAKSYLNFAYDMDVMLTARNNVEYARNYHFKQNKFYPAYMVSKIVPPDVFELIDKRYKEKQK